MAHKEAQDLCSKHMYRYVGIQTADGMIYDGLIEGVDEENVMMAVPAGEEEEMRSLGLGYPYARPPYYGPAYGYGIPYPYGYYPYPYPRRRFNRLILPLATFIALSLLPYY